MAAFYRPLAYPEYFPGGNREISDASGKENPYQPKGLDLRSRISTNLSIYLKGKCC